MKSYKNPKPFEVEIENIQGEKFVLTAKSITPVEMEKIQGIIKDKANGDIESLNLQFAYIFNEPVEFFNNFSYPLLGQVIKDFFNELTNPIQG